MSQTAAKNWQKWAVENNCLDINGHAQYGQAATRLHLLK